MKIGLRIPGSAAQMTFPAFCEWVKNSGFQGIDIGSVTDDVKNAMDAHGLEIGTADLFGLEGLFEDDSAAERSISSARATIDAAADRGVTRMFVVLVPRNGAPGRESNFGRLTETFGPILTHAESRGVQIALEGWPGPGPHYPAIGVTPESLRALFRAFPSPALRLNYDPSHLIRIGVDHIRFLHEFGDRVIHCHGKDAILDPEALYLHGNLGPTFGRARHYGEDWWRYTIPGEGSADWPRILAHLQFIGYEGFVSVELEDFRYYRTWESESLGLVRAQKFLASLI